MPPDLEPLYPALRLVTGKFVTFTELEGMTIDDVDDLNIVLAAEADYGRRYRKAAERK